MEVFEAILKRRSVRKFDRKKPVSDEQIEKLLEAARWAPSAGNQQSWFFFVIKNPAIRKKLVLAAFGQIYLAQASVVFVVCADSKRSGRIYGKRGETFFAIQNATLAAYNIWLAAVEMGLGAVWIGAFSEKLVVKILKLPAYLHPIALLPIGYPAHSPQPHSRRPIGEISKII